MKILDGQDDQFPVDVNLDQELFPVNVVSLEDLIKSTKNESRFVTSPGLRLAFYRVLFLVL